MGPDEPDDEETGKIASFAEGTKKRAAHGISVNRRRHEPDQCQHKGPYRLDRTLAHVECGDCGALLDPMFVLQVLAAHEAYWNERVKDLTRYAKQVEKELDGRTRTKCTHCGNMTAIRLSKEKPRTWFAGVDL